MNNKTSDKNVGGIEDDIKILENLKSYLNLLIYEGNDKIIYNDLLWDEKTVDCIYAMENLINDYTRQKQINEEHQKINGELKKAINTAEKEKGEWIEECQQKDERIQELEDKLQDINTYILINGIDKPLRTATQIQVENQHEYIIQQKINELEKERDHWHGCFIVAMENSIPKQVVIDEINEINKKYEDSKDENGENPYFYPNFTIKTLQKLLEGEK